MTKLNTILALALALIISGCGKDPGPLAGTWKMKGVVPMTVIYRDGEEEAMGIISKVSYEQRGNDVLVTYLDALVSGIIKSERS
jgi:hypothetical protein